MDIKILPAATHHLPGILDIVNHAILHTTAVYDYDPKTPADIETWLNDKQAAQWPVIVAELNGEVLGYASYGTFRFKEGFKYTVEHSVYVSNQHTGMGIGYKLMEELITIAKKKGLHTMIGCIDADNKGSIDFHKKFGFTEAGILTQSGYKFNRWLDLLFMQLMLE
ncbi:GNAT family N-acetyltransferase [Flavobacterium sp. Sd200]|uniref:GNAT family N-acetyltransferase n=1 Tax=Flavobacterium sp. Sd200 TaxID=2692211 RepID=UPI00136BD090|nr:GNAT family N-acetyltransferase [Flavobacterium sp. Sd200]MXN90351.1 GNAT family N-acetyltransferase [Flavobacterium sp. Sd200]